MSTCGSGTRAEDYNLPLHVGSVFIIFAVSAGACAFPVLAIRFPQLRIPPNVHFGFRHFGTGVLIATAFVHLFPTAFESLLDPCLPPFFTEDYPAMTGAIALAAVFIITVAEMVFSPGRSLCSGPTETTEGEGTRRDIRAGVAPEPSGNSISRSDSITPAGSTPQFGYGRSGRTHSTMKTPHGDQVPAPADTFQLSGGAAGAPATVQSSGHLPEARVSDDSFTLFEEKVAEQERKKLLVQCVMLECGILFHSIFIGLALAVAVGSEQVILIIAIAFHQIFEGLALGSRIAVVGWKPKALQPWLMAMAYGCTTPLGQAIGIATRNLYDPDSATGLIVVGVFNAFSGGLLTYTSLVDLLSEDFLSDHSWRTLRGKKRATAMSILFSGAFCMALIGAWA